MKNKTLLMTIAILLSAMYSVAQVNETFTDTRDGKTYKTVVIGSQIWMAENFAYKSTTGCWAYDHDENNVATYGYLYDLTTAKKVCPTGWHLPTDAEWTTLISYLGGEKAAGSKLKSVTGWKDYNKDATNSTSFSALGGGIRVQDDTYSYLGMYGYWYSSSLASANEVWGILLNSGSWEALRVEFGVEGGYSVRYICDKDIFVGKWTADGSEIFTITKNGSVYHFRSNLSSDGNYSDMDAKLVNGELVGRAEDDMTNKNTIIKIIGTEMHVINLYGNNLTLHKLK